MKKRNMVLEILVCAALAVAVFLGYMIVAAKDGGPQIRDISGDRAQLNGFSFDGIAGDPSGFYHFIWENGSLRTKYQPLNGWDMDAFLSAEKEGKPLGKYFAKQRSQYTWGDNTVFPVSAKGAKRKQISDLSELTKENRLEILSETDISLSNMEVKKGYVSDRIELYAEVSDFDNGSGYTRFPTGLTFSGEEFYFIEFGEPDTERGAYTASEREMGISATETADAFYAILQTNADCEGEVFLQRIPKADMEPGWGNDLMWERATCGKAEVLHTFRVDENDCIIGLTHISEDRLLLARSEEDVLLLEIYDTEGNFITRLKTDVEQVSQYELNHIRLLRHPEETVIWFDLPRKIYNDGTEKNGFHYELDGGRYYVCDEKGIRELPVNGYPEYLDHADGKVLFVEEQKAEGKQEMKELLEVYQTGYHLKVLDDETGKVLYEGALTSDFQQDYYRKLSVLNIGRRAGYLSERKERVENWPWDEIEKVKIRSFRQLLSLDGEMEDLDWSGTNRFGYRENCYYE